MLTDRGLLVNEYLETDAPLFTENRLVEEEDFEVDVIVEEACNIKAKDISQSIRRKRTMRDIFSLKTQRFLTEDGRPLQKKSSSLLSNFKHSNGSGKTKFIIGLIVAFINGFIGATHAIIIGRLIALLNPYTVETDLSDEFSEVVSYAIPLIIIMMVLGYLQSYLMKSSTACLEFSMRSLFFRSLLRQEVEFFSALDL